MVIYFVCDVLDWISKLIFFALTPGAYTAVRMHGQGQSRWKVVTGSSKRLLLHVCNRFRIYFLCLMFVFLKRWHAGQVEAEHFLLIWKELLLHTCDIKAQSQTTKSKGDAEIVFTSEIDWHFFSFFFDRVAFDYKKEEIRMLFTVYSQLVSSLKNMGNHDQMLYMLYTHCMYCGVSIWYQVLPVLKQS